MHKLEIIEMVVHPVHAGLNHRVEVFERHMLGHEQRAHARKLVEVETQVHAEELLLGGRLIDFDAVLLEAFVCAFGPGFCKVHGFSSVARHYESVFYQGIEHFVVIALPCAQFLFARSLLTLALLATRFCLIPRCELEQHERQIADYLVFFHGGS